MSKTPYFHTSEGLQFNKLPTLYLYHKKIYYKYLELFNFEYFLFFINRHLYPIVHLKTRQEINSFKNTKQEFEENTPFYTKGYLPISPFFPYFSKVTRVIAFIANKREYKEELAKLHSAALESGIRDDLRVAKVTNPDLVDYYKDKFGTEWFDKYSKNSIVIFRYWKYNDTGSPEIDFYNLAEDNLDFGYWLGLASLSECDELTSFTQRIYSVLDMPLFIAFVEPKGQLRSERSKKLLKNLQELALKYPKLLFSFAYADRFKDQKERMGISWNSLPALGFSNNGEEDQKPFPQGVEFSIQNLKIYFDALVDGNLERFRLGLFGLV